VQRQRISEHTKSCVEIKVAVHDTKQEFKLERVFAGVLNGLSREDGFGWAKKPEVSRSPPRDQI
jgi:hypothetical protein